MRVNKAGKKRDFTFCGPAMGPDSESHHDEWWHPITTEPSNQTPTASECETLNLYKQETHLATQKLPFWTGQAAVNESPHNATIKSVSGLNTEEASFVWRLLH